MPADLQLRYAVADARNFLSAVKHQNSGYYATVETSELFDWAGLRSDLPTRLRELATTATADDTIMLFASGHGYRAPDGKLYLLVTESDQTQLEATSLSWDELAQAFGETRARIIVFIDACHSGADPQRWQQRRDRGRAQCASGALHRRSRSKGAARKFRASGPWRRCLHERYRQSDHRSQTQQYRYRSERRHRAVGALQPNQARRTDADAWQTDPVARARKYGGQIPRF